MLKTFVLLKVFEETVLQFFKEFLINVKIKKTAIEIFCDIINLFSVTFKHPC